jgi:formiminoglutamase
MEIALSAYLADEAAPWAFDETKAASLQTALSATIEAALAAAAAIERSRS